MNVVLQHRKFREYFTENFAKMFTLKIKSIKKICHIFLNFGKNYHFKMLSKDNNGEHNICKTNIFWGRDIVQGRVEILPKVSPNVSTKF